MIYPPCRFTERYPILRRIAPEEREAWVAQAERGEALTDEQSARLGFAPCIKGGVLVPADGSMSAAQMTFAFPGRDMVIREIIALGTQATEQKIS